MKESPASTICTYIANDPNISHLLDLSSSFIVILLLLLFNKELKVELLSLYDKNFIYFLYFSKNLKLKNNKPINFKISREI